MNKIIPKNAQLIPTEAKKVFKGEIFEVYQWPQKMFDGSTEIFEMLRRPDTVSVIPIKDNKLVALRQMQPHWPAPKFGFPGGRVDDTDQSTLDAVKRELLEETGLTFSKWKLIDVQQREEKIEWFHYKYIAYGDWEQHDTIEDVGERLEVEEINFDDAKANPNNELRLGKGILEKYSSLQELLDAPEYTN